MSPTQTVVVGFDFSDSSKEALDRALRLAIRAPFHVLHIACVIEPHVPLPAVPGSHVDYQYADRVQHAMTDEISARLNAAEETGRVHFCVHARIGKPATELLALASEVGADLILVGSKGLTGIERLVLGSVAEKIVREAGCTVEVARAKTYPDVELQHIVEVVHHDTYVPPHRYTYEHRGIQLRPLEWPLY